MTMSVGVRAAILAPLLLLAGCIGPEGTEILGTEYRDPPDAPDFTLKNQFGEDISLSDFDGNKVVFLGHVLPMILACSMHVWVRFGHDSGIGK